MSKQSKLTKQKRTILTKKRKLGAVLVLIMAVALALYSQGYPALWRESDEDGTGTAPPTNTSDPSPSQTTDNIPPPSESDDPEDDPPEEPPVEPPEPEPLITLFITPDEFSPLPEEPITASISTNRPNAAVALMRKLKGGVDADGNPGPPHVWGIALTGQTDGDGDSDILLNPATQACGIWQYKAVLLASSTTSNIVPVTVLGMYIEVDLIFDAPSRHELEIRVYTSFPQVTEIEVWDSWDLWVTKDIVFPSLSTDEGGYAYGNFITGRSGTVSYRAEGPYGDESYNTATEHLS